MEAESDGLGERLVIFAPVGRDAELLASFVESRGFTPCVTGSITEFAERFREGLGAAVLTEEALHNGRAKQLFKLVEEQPAWSDVPFVVIASPTQPGLRERRLAELARPLRNVTLIERPLRLPTIASLFDVVIRDRKRQYALRETMENLQSSERQYRDLAGDLEERIQDRTSELVEANREMEGFNYSVAHDLRAPLRNIVTTCVMLRLDFGDHLPEEAIRLLKEQEHAARKLSDLMNDLLHLSRLSRQALQRDRLDISAMASVIIAGMKGRGVGLTCQFTVQPKIIAHGDATLIQLALENLLENAVKFSPDGGCIEVGQEEIDGLPTIFVRDQGIGFDMAYQHKIFQLFERLVTDAEFPGTGVGLANVQRIIHRHGGKIWVDSTPGKGTTFYFRL
jgi:signal transduction histidine kinase